MQQASVVAAASPSSSLSSSSSESPSPSPITTSPIKTSPSSSSETSCKIGEVNYVLKSLDPNFTIEAIRGGDYHRWGSVLVDKKESERITNGYFDAPVLKEIVATAFDNINHGKEEKGVKAEVNVCSTGDILFVITLKEHFSTRRFEIPLTHQQDDPIVRLEHIVREQAGEIRILREQIKVLKIKTDRQIMVGHHPGPISNPQAAVDAANIKLGAGKWAVHYSFFYTLDAPSTGGGWIYFDLMYGTASVKDQGNKRGHFVPNFISPNKDYPVNVSGVAIIDNADSHQEVYLRFTPYTTQPTYTNVVLVAHPVE